MDGPHWQGATPRVVSGTTFDGVPYRISLPSTKPFGRGGSAVIHKGELLDVQPLVVAVKIFHDFGPISKELLEQELRAARQVSMCHPFILAFLGTADVGHQAAIVSLYMRNGNLLDYLKLNPGCDKKQLILQVAQAVDHIHSVERLVHGDLKCENILVSDYGEALLADFGLSTFVDKLQSDRATMTGIRQMHTARFAAPELLLSGSDLFAKPPSKTPESDVYAFGMLVLQAVTGELPWFGAVPKDLAFGNVAVMLHVLNGKHPPQPTSPAGFVSISHAWWDVCKSCWSREPSTRPRMPLILEALALTDVVPYRKLAGHTNVVRSIAYFPDGHRVVSVSVDNSIRIWDSRTCRTVIGPILGHRGTVCCVAVSPDGHHICSGGEDCTIRLWDAESGAPIGRPMTGHNAFVRCVAYSPDGTRIVSCSSDKTVRLWDAATGQALGDPLAGHTNAVWSVAFSPDGACIASGSGDGTIRRWDSATGASLGILGHAELPVFSVAFSPDRIHLISGDYSGTVRIWNLSTRQPERRLKGHSDWLRSVAVSRGYIASGSGDQTICIWDAHTGYAVGVPLVGHTDYVRSVAFSPDGRSLGSGSSDETVRIWDLFE